MADPLIGKFFSAYKTKEGGEREMTWNGQVRSRVKEGVYLVKVMDAVSLVMIGMVSFAMQTMVSLDEMKEWEFFDSRDEWESSYGAYARQQEAARVARRQS
ncbi:MAG TPA: hypothetical protein VGB13_00760 [Candidatus Krumholzibacteria bacterium]